MLCSIHHTCAGTLLLASPLYQHEQVWCKVSSTTTCAPVCAGETYLSLVDVPSLCAQDKTLNLFSAGLGDLHGKECIHILSFLYIARLLHYHDMGGYNYL